MEVEIMKLEGITKELVEEMDYLKRREERFAATNCKPSFVFSCAVAAC
jgi:p24 family protein delta-1